MRGYATSGDPKTMHIRKWLTDNCFGDYYTRGGLDYKQREMITFFVSYMHKVDASHKPLPMPKRI